MSACFLVTAESRGSPLLLHHPGFHHFSLLLFPTCFSPPGQHCFLLPAPSLRFLDEPRLAPAYIRGAAPAADSSVEVGTTAADRFGNLRYRRTTGADERDRGTHCLDNATGKQGIDLIVFGNEDPQVSNAGMRLTLR